VTERSDLTMVHPTGVWILPPDIASWLGFWSAWDQRQCPHPLEKFRWISGDERLYGYRGQCMACGRFWK
jgi:hypothetical protein